MIYVSNVSLPMLIWPILYFRHVLDYNFWIKRGEKLQPCFEMPRWVSGKSDVMLLFAFGLKQKIENQANHHLLNVMLRCILKWEKIEK